MFIHEGGISRRVDVRVKAGEVGPGFSFGVKRFVEVKGNVGDACAHALVVEIQLEDSSTGDTARSINPDVVFEDKLGVDGKGVLTGDAKDRGATVVGGREKERAGRGGSTPSASAAAC